MNLDFLKNGQVGEVSEDINTIKLVDLGISTFRFHSLLENCIVFAYIRKCHTKTQTFSHNLLGPKGT